MRAILRALLLGLVCACGVQPLRAQDDPVLFQDDAVRVFFDCQGGCDFDYVRREVTFVNYVRDRADADVHLMIISQGTGSGGRLYTLNFIGLRNFEGMSDTLQLNTAQSATDDDRRRDLTRTIKLGLIRYAATTSIVSGLDVSFQTVAQPTGTPLTAASDPWNYWIFRINANGNAGGEKLRNNHSFNGTLTANRTTEAWKFNFRVNARYSETNTTRNDGTTANNTQREYNGNTLLVKSIGDHFSIGSNASFNSSLFSNEELAVRIAPALEYSFYPYEESSRRQLRVLYTVGVRRVDYHDETIYLKTQETLTNESLELSYGVRQPWGDAGISVIGSHYFHDTGFYRLQVGGDLSMRLFRGFSFNVGADYSRINDQLSLRAGGASDEDLLQQRQQLQTNYRYGMNFGLSYQFGSIFNNVVNPRLGG